MVLVVLMISCSDMITVLGTVELSFDSQGGSPLEPKYLERGTVFADFPDPSREGYTFSGWYRTKTFAGNPVTELKITQDKNIPLFAKWTVNSGTRYRVEHYQQNIDDDAYTLASTDSMAGTTDTNATASANTYAGFTENTSHASRLQSGNIAGDGSLVLKLYYDRNLHTLSFNSKGGSPIDSITVIRYGAMVTEPSSPTKVGYGFVRWYEDDNLTAIWDFSSDTVTEDTTLYAKWSSETNTAFDVEHYQQNADDNGYTLESTENLTGTTDTNATAVTKSYTGFTENTSHSSRIVSGNIAGDGSLVLRLYYDRNPHTLSFNSNGGSAVGPISGIKYGAKATEPSSPTRAGYVFVGWYKESGLSNIWDFASDRVTANTTLFAMWTANTNTAYTVEHYQQNADDNGYTLAGTDSLAGTTDTNATAVTKSYTGFTENTSHASRIVSGNIAGDGSLVLRLYYDRNPHTLSFNSNGGSAVGPISGIKYGAMTTEPTAPTRPGYSFVDWYKESGLSNIWDFASDRVTVDTTLFAKWTANTNTAYKVEHYQQNTDDNGYALADTDMLAGTTDTNISASANTYTGFTENKTHASRIKSGNIAGDGSLVLRLYYDRDLHTLSFASNGGSSVDPITAIRYGAKANAPGAPTRTGYDFAGWYKDSGLSNAWNFSSDTVTGDTTLYAKWTLQTFAVSFVSNGGTSVSDITDVPYNTTFTEPATPSKIGYAFAGWYKESGLSNIWNFASDRVTVDTTLFAKWTANTNTAYKVEHYQQDANDTYYTLESIENKVGTTAATVSAVAKSYPGFTENTGHWYRKASGTVTGNGSLVLKLYYDRNLHTLSFASNGGTSVDPITAIRYGAKANAPGAPTRTGYDFTGWYKEAGLSTVWNFSSDTVTGDTTLYAKWTLQTFAVSFVSNGGSGVSVISDVDYDTTVTEPTAPTKAGYDFAGWYKESGLSNTWNFASDRVTATTTLYARWTGKSFLVTFDNQEGSGGSTSVSVVYGEAMPIATAPTKTNYTFKGYFDAVSGGGKQYYSEDMISVRAWDKPTTSTLYAYWVGKLTYITLDRQGASSGSSYVFATHGSPMPTIYPPSRPGYTFDGYYTSVTGGGTQYYNADSSSAIDWDATSNITKLYAKWASRTYTVTLDQQGGTGGSTTVSATYGAKLPTATAPTKAGDVFDGYYSAPNGQGTKYYYTDMTGFMSWNLDDDSTIYAKWREYEVGDIGPAGGYIFYKKNYKTEGWQYLSAAPKGWNGTASDPMLMWGGYSITTGATGMDFGTGLSNTTKIVSKGGSGTYAAKACSDYSVTVNGVVYDQWYLPSGDELKRLAQGHYGSHQANMVANYYWSSTEVDPKFSYIFYSGGTGLNLAPTERIDSNKRLVRPIRRF